MTFAITTTSAEDTLRLGERLGRKLKGGETLELASDLGGGKTVLVKGIARGLGYTGEVTSPTFTISRVYQIRAGLELHHFDFYRVASEDIVGAELAEVVGQPDVIVAVEWAGNIPEALPADRIRVIIEKKDEYTRLLRVESLTPKFDYVVEALS